LGVGGHRASNPVSVKNVTAIETSTIVKLLRPYVPVGTKKKKKKKKKKDRKWIEESVMHGLTIKSAILSLKSG
jgi:hypothetical protein